MLFAFVADIVAAVVAAVVTPTTIDASTLYHHCKSLGHSIRVHGGHCKDEPLGQLSRQLRGSRHHRFRSAQVATERPMVLARARAAGGHRGAQRVRALAYIQTQPGLALAQSSCRVGACAGPQRARACAARGYRACAASSNARACAAGASACAVLVSGSRLRGRGVGACAAPRRVRACAARGHRACAAFISGWRLRGRD